jgi:hypothetical protein
MSTPYKRSREASMRIAPLQVRRTTWLIKLTRNKIKKITNKILAMPAAATATPANPKKPAIIAITRKTSAQ